MKCCLLKRPLLRAYCSFLRISILRAFPNYFATSLLYQKRFDLFSTHFYKKVYSGEVYPLDYAEQVKILERPEDNMLFLALNSCWQIDHYFQQRAGINMDALTRAIDQLQDGKYDNWLKIAVLHHPVTGKGIMNDEFLELLSVHNFQICMHGHIDL